MPQRWFEAIPNRRGRMDHCHHPMPAGYRHWTQSRDAECKRRRHRLDRSKERGAASAKLAIGISAAHRGLGCGTEAVSSLIAAFAGRPTNVWVEPVKVPSLRVLLGWGFRIVGRSSEAGGSAEIRFKFCDDDPLPSEPCVWQRRPLIPCVALQGPMPSDGPGSGP